jgi:hypothetical protein
VRSIGSPQSKDGNDRLEEKVDLVLQAVDKEGKKEIRDSIALIIATDRGVEQIARGIGSHVSHSGIQTVSPLNKAASRQSSDNLLSVFVIGREEPDSRNLATVLSLCGVHFPTYRPCPQGSHWVAKVG